MEAFYPYDPVHGALQLQHQIHNTLPPPPPPPQQPPPQHMDLASSPLQPEKPKPGRPRRSRTSNVNVNNVNNGPPAESSSAGAASSSSRTGIVSNGRVIEIKTKFPVARIKRIMQADEDVGKVAQVKPVLPPSLPSFFVQGPLTQRWNRSLLSSSPKH